MRTLTLLAALFVAGQPVFRTGVELVRIPISLSATGEAPAPSEALTVGHFTVFEDGVPQQVSLLERDPVPLRMCIVLDISHSMMEPGAARLSTGAYGHVVNLLGPTDDVAVITFAMRNSLVIPWTSAQKASQTPLQLTTEGGTAILDAVKRALREMDKAKSGRAIILVITDGGENISYSGLGEVVATRVQSETQIYGFRIAGTPSTTPVSVTKGRPMTDADVGLTTVDVLPQLVMDSGGSIYDIATEADVPTATTRLLEELRQQYTLAYTPSKPFDGKYRRVKVEMNTPGYAVRHRGGYLALPQR